MKPRTIQITPVLNGFVVQVGCQTVVLKSAAELAMQINEYYTDPKKVEVRFLKEKVNDTMDNGHINQDCVGESPREERNRSAPIIPEPQPYTSAQCETAPPLRSPR